MPFHSTFCFIVRIKCLPSGTTRGVDASPPRSPVTSRRPTSNIYMPYFNISSAPALPSSSHLNILIFDNSVIV